jgi:Tfp pilus assembly protein PilV
MRRTTPSPKKRSQAGFTLIEVIIASVLLIVGVAAMSGLVGLTIKNNGHSRLDTSATMITQSVIEQVSSGIADESYGGTGTAYIYDCTGTGTGLDNTWPVNVESGGANLDTNGNIDFTQDPSTIPTGYQMDYVACHGNIRTTYDVRWKIVALPNSTSVFTNLLIVGARIKGGGPAIINFPINMHVMVGPDPIHAS